MVKLRGVYIAVLVLFVVGTLVALGVHRDHDLNSGFERVSIGMSHGQVDALMGSAKMTKGCVTGPFASSHPDRCVESDVYPCSFVPLDPEFWVVWFDRDKRVIGKNQYQSP
jgi:hypothetical protein